MHFCCDISIVPSINLVLWFYLVASVPATQTAVWRIHFGISYFHTPLTNNVNEVKTKSIINTAYNTNRLHTHNKETGTPQPSPPGWRNEPHALSHPFPSCSALACSSVEPPCCRSESLGCQRETGAEIRDHPPSPPVSITSSPVAVARGIA